MDMPKFNCQRCGEPYELGTSVNFKSDDMILDLSSTCPIRDDLKQYEPVIFLNINVCRKCAREIENCILSKDFLYTSKNNKEVL